MMSDHIVEIMRRSFSSVLYGKAYGDLLPDYQAFVDVAVDRLQAALALAGYTVVGPQGEKP